MKIDDLEIIAPDMERMRLDNGAKPGYDLMSDSLVWPDEIPPGRRARELWCLRPVLRFRTGLILGLELSEFQPAWEAATRAFPRWIGFLEERTRQTPILEETYHKLSKK
jgi:hypothetical protein